LIWLEATPLADWVRMSTMGYPLMITLHAIGMGVMVGIALMLDGRLLGKFAGIPYQSLQRFLGIGWVGLGINTISGSCLFAAQATQYIVDPVYMTKMGLVLLGAITAAMIQTWLNRDAANWEAASPPANVRVVAVLSIVFWVTAIVTGRLTAYL
jgi:hypothetical protein